MMLALAAAVSLATPDPYQIFARARAYWLTQRYPMKMQYEVAVSATEGGKARVERYDSGFDAVKNEIVFDPVSDYDRAHPVDPTGVNFSIGLAFLAIPVGKPLPPIDWLGVPKLAPTYSFGMAPFVPAPTPTPFNSAALVEQIRQEFHDPNPRAVPTPSATPGIPEIATVVAHDRNYTITFLGTETIDGHACYHLAVQPQRDPGRLRIRQAWIDETSYATWQLLDASNFRNGVGTRVPWTMHFADVDGAHYISEEDASAPMARRGEIFSHVAVRFEDLPAVTALSLERPLVPGGNFIDEP